MGLRLTGQHYLSTMTQLQPVPLLGRLAPEARDLVVGFGIQLLALQNPVAAAEEVVSLDVLCGERLVYGVGLGCARVCPSRPSCRRSRNLLRGR